MEIRIEPLKGEEETERGEYKKASKDFLFSRGEQKVVTDMSTASAPMCFIIHSQDLGFLSFSF